MPRNKEDDLTILDGEDLVDHDNSSNNELLDLLYSTPIDHVKAKEQDAFLFLPAGNYMWKGGKCTITVSDVQSDKKPSDIYTTKGKGRTVIRLGGMVVSITPPRREGYFTLAFSPDFREYNGLGDGLYKAYKLARDFYFDQLASDPQNFGMLCDFLRAAEYTMYITQSKTNGQNYLGSFKAL